MADIDPGFERMGAHGAKREGAILIVRWAGEVSLDDMKALYERIDEMGREFPMTEEGRAYLEAERERHASLR